MSDPVTIGDLAASALALAAPEVIKSAVGEAVKDAYKALKEKIAIWASGDVEALTNEPDSKGRQLTVAEKIDKQSPDDQSVVEALAKALMDALEARRQVIPRLPPRPASLGFRRISYRLVAISTPRQIFPSSRLCFELRSSASGVAQPVLREPILEWLSPSDAFDDGEPNSLQFSALGLSPCRNIVWTRRRSTQNPRVG